MATPTWPRLPRTWTTPSARAHSPKLMPLMGHLSYWSTLHRLLLRLLLLLGRSHELLVLLLLPQHELLGLVSLSPQQILL
eukprot:m.205394 g.205394  ORF g.205394 m.205394 type:complete len:80 (-) comp22019_c1_seq1:75-314(-)